jgi:hypothetical protein
LLMEPSGETACFSLGGRSPDVALDITLQKNN